MVAATPGPVPAQERIPALDAARGLALLGIFLVNIQLFFLPFGHLLELRPPAAAGDAAAWWFVKVFCEGKFYPLFSMLFGMGLVLQLERARAAGRPFTGMYLRRLALLACFGVVHIVLIWAGDILLVYSVAGLILLLCSRLSARSLLACAGGLLVIVTVITFAAGALGMFAGKPPKAEPTVAVVAPGAPPASTEAGAASGAPQPPPGTPPESGAAKPGSTPSPAPKVEDRKFEGPFWQTPFGRLIQGFESRTVGPPNSPLWMETETEAFRNGPFSQALLFRLLTYACFLVFMVFGFGWHVLAMFMLGAALMRLRIFDPGRRVWHRRFVIVGGAVGLPLVVLAVVLMGSAGARAMAVAAPLGMIGATLMSLGYLGAVTLIASRERAPAICLWLASAGRMALSVYLAESVAATFFSYHWGLAWFGQLGASGRIALAVGIYAALVIAANLWLRVFRMGPMEWVWRRGTYLGAA